MPDMFRMAITEPTSIDPYRAQEVEGVLVTKLLYAGLLALDADQRLAPAVATSRECSDDGMRWTFVLDPDAVFSNGEPVEAASFVRAWNRAADPTAGSETTYHLAGIRGWEALQAGTADRLAGLGVPDRHTLTVELSSPDFEFDTRTLQPVFSPVPTVAAAAVDPAFNDEPVGNGPFRLAGPWRHDEGIRLVRNERYAGPAPALDEIEITILHPAGALEREYAGFEAGEYDFARIPPGSVAKAQDRYPEGFLEQDLAGVTYLLPFLANPPMDRLAAREAVSYAIDRDDVIRRAFDGYRTRAASLVPPTFAAHQPDLAPSCVSHDAERARELAAQAGLCPGTPLDIAFNIGAGHEGWVSAVAEQLRRVLDLDVRLHAMTPRALVEYRTGPAAAGLCRAAWACDYPTPDNVLYPLLHSACTNPDADGVAHGDNEGRYANPRFDELVRQARATRDEGERDEWFRRAERVAVGDDLAIIPMWYRTHHRVYAADRFTGLALDFFGNPTLSDVRRSSGPPGRA